jgi:putative inorganic carbon (HCO3(-)) transporter
LRIVVTALFCVFALSPLPIGANRPWAWLLISGLCFLLMAAWLVMYLKGNMQISRAFQSDPVIIAIGLFFCSMGWTFLQAFAYPLAWVEALPVPTAALYDKAAAVIVPQERAETIPLSVDSSVTGELALRSAAYFFLFILILLVFDTRSRLRTFCYVIVLSGVFQAVYGSFMTLSGIEYLLGIKKTAYLGNATGTFVNRNHFAGYLEMALAIGMGLLMVDRNDRKPEAGRLWRSKLRSILELLLSGKAVLRLMLIIMVTGLILSHSRMGNAAFFNSLLITGLIAMAVSPSFRKPNVYILLISIIAVDVFLLGSWFGLEKVVNRIEQTAIESESRDEIVQYILPMIADFGWTGSGAGTFISVFPVYLNGNFGGYDHAHNDYLELLSDLGFIGFACLTGVVLIGLWQAVKAMRHRRSSFVRGMGFAGFMGTLSILIHSTVDFNLQIPANAILFIAMLALPTMALSIDLKSKRAEL